MTPKQFIKARYALDLAQWRLAEVLGLTSRQIIRYENGTTPVPKSIAMLLDILVTSKIPKI
jgi:transcriptional regulator with XRE-family HTH domain